MLENSEENAEKKVEITQENKSSTSENTDKTEEKEVATTESETTEVIETVEEVSEKVETSKDDAEDETTETTEAIDAVEKEVAEEAEKEVEKETVSVIDYSKMDLESLVDALQELIKNHPINQIKNQVEGIKSAFNQQFGTLLSAKKAVFLEEGGNVIDFHFSSPIKASYNKLLSEYKEKRDAHYKNLETQLKGNLEKRMVVIDSLKNLIADADSKTMYKNFRELQDQWRAIGPVSKTRYNDTWKTYHHHVERFYDLLHLSNDFRDLDFKHNLEKKLKIIEQAKVLSEKEDINVAFKELQNLHKLWKEDIGPVAREMREEIWHKFSEATKKIHDKRHDYFRSQKSKFQEIIDKKNEIISEIESYDSSSNKSHSDWQKSIKDIEALRQKYFSAGKLPYSKSEAIWQKFKTATKRFNQSKNLFYKQEKGGQQENLNKKKALIELAESLKDSDDWETTTNTMKKIQADWKKVGHVPRKFSDALWKRFKGACNHFFDRLHENKNTASKEEQAVIDSKKSFLEQLKSTKYATLESVKEAISSWKELGQLPRNVRHLEGKFYKQIDKALEALSLGKEEIEMLKFRNNIQSALDQKDYRKIESEQFYLRKKIDETVREMQQLENNLSFISNATEDNPLVQNVRKQITTFKENLDIWQSKLNYLRKIDY